LDCSSEDFKGMDGRVLWFKTGMHVYDVVEMAEEYAVEVSPSL
jgi:predicted nuclease of restriction endonuclease-like RecB superfamily